MITSPGLCPEEKKISSLRRDDHIIYVPCRNAITEKKTTRENGDDIAFRTQDSQLFLFAKNDLILRG